MHRLGNLPLSALDGPDPQTREFPTSDKAEVGRFSRLQAFQSIDGSLASTANDYNNYFQRLLSQKHENQRTLSRPAAAHIPNGQGPHGGWYGGTGTSTYTRSVNALTGILLTQNFWKTLCQTIETNAPGAQRANNIANLSGERSRQLR